MKTCPTCQRKYEDASIVFCLEDGARLRDITERDPEATLHLGQLPGPTVRSPGSPPRPTVPAQATITARPDQYQVVTPDRSGDSDRASTRKSALPWVFAIVVVMAIAGVLMAWLLTRGGDDRVAKNESPTPQPSASATPTFEPTAQPTRSPADDDATPRPTPTATQEPRATPEPTKEKPKSMFAVLNNTSFNGSRITYYPRQTFGQCQSDCAANSACRGFTWIKPGAYNPGDSAMCYLMSAVTARVPDHRSISGVRN